MTIHRTDSEEEALFRSYPYAVYYVQSPSTVSHATNHESTPERPCFTAATNMMNPTSKESLANLLALSRYSSSRGSTSSSFLVHEKKMPYDHDVQSHGTGVTVSDDKMLCNAIVVADHEHHQHAVSNNIGGKEGRDHHLYYGEDDDDDGRNDVWWRLLSFGHSSSAGWKFLQISWRFVVSMMVALVVFYILTKPPPPNISVQISRVPEFELAEGVDATGVTTKILRCNFSVDVTIDNKSKLFPLHIHPPFLAMSFANLPFAAAQGPQLEVGTDGVQYLTLYVGTRKKPMYGAGRSMQDLLDSKKGLPLSIKIELRSRFDVVWGLIKPKFHHQAECLVLLDNVYDKKHRTQEFISRCSLSS